MPDFITALKIVFTLVVLQPLLKCSNILNETQWPNVNYWLYFNIFSLWTFTSRCLKFLNSLTDNRLNAPRHNKNLSCFYLFKFYENQRGKIPLHLWPLRFDALILTIIDILYFLCIHIPQSNRRTTKRFPIISSSTKY